jgi:hypothetical protein
MKNTILKTVTAFSVLAGTAFAASSAQAVVLQNGDFLKLDIKFRATKTSSLVPNGGFNLVEFEKAPFVGTFAAVGDQGNFEVSDSLLGGTDNLANNLVGDINSFDLADVGQFIPTLPIDTSFPLTNTFTPTGSAVTSPFFTLDLGGGDGLEFTLGEITTTQNNPLTQNGTSSVTVTGTGILRSLLPDNSATTPVDFSSSIVFNKTTQRWESDGGLTLIVNKKTPEASTTMGLLALGLLGGSSLLKKRNKIA